MRPSEFAALCNRRRAGEPVAYLTGTREFWGLTLAVTPDVLIPRPETETLVEFALSKLPRDSAVQRARPGHRLRRHRTGIGARSARCGRARDRPFGGGVAVARDNARRLELTNVAFAAADWYEGIPTGYVRPDREQPALHRRVDPHLHEGDLRFEPVSALSPGVDGHAALRTIVGGARERLVPGGWLVVEHGYDQSDAVQALFRDAGFSRRRGVARPCRYPARRRRDIQPP